MEPDLILNRIHNMFTMARKDPKYAAMTREYNVLEKQFAQIARRLSDEEQDILWGFVCTSDGMNWRILELVCEREIAAQIPDVYAIDDFSVSIPPL